MNEHCHIRKVGERLRMNRLVQEQDQGQKNSDTIKGVIISACRTFQSFFEI